MPSKKIAILLITMVAFVMAACSGLKATSNGGNGGGGVGVTATISVQVAGLGQGASVILQNMGGDSLTVTTNGTFSFKTQASSYNVTVNTQPTNPNQICNVTNGQGTPTTTTVTLQVSCVNSYTIGGQVSGLVGDNFALQNSDGTILETLKVPAANGNAAFTFTQLVPTGSTYTVTISAQPSNPSQTCTVMSPTGTGTAMANVNSVVVTCAAVTYSVGGTVVGLEGITPNNGALVDSSFVIQNVLGNTLIIPQNGPFTFATPEALNDQYEISVFHGPSTQSEGCTLWDYKGVVTTNITSIIVDCGHNDWTWIDGTKTAGTVIPVTPQYGSFAGTAPTSIPNPFTNTPGARYGAAGWTDGFGSLYLFGGTGWELAGKPQPDTLNFAMNDLWVCDMSWGDFCQWQLVGGYDKTAITVNGKATTVGAQIQLGAQNASFYTFVVPAGRLGAATWKDSSGNFWLFGGSDGNNFLNDLWEYNHASLNPTSYTTTEGLWNFIGGSMSVDRPGVYPPAAPGIGQPGARTNAVTWTDQAGNFWLFGGYGYDGQAIPVLGFLNDLWEYTGGSWVFIGGSTTANQLGVYGTAGTALASNQPGARQEAVGWADAHGNLWLFGGEGLDDVGTPNGILNDLWVYNIASNQWTWVMGAETVPNSTRANHNGVYPSQPVIGPVNTTGAASTCGLASGLTVNGQVLCSPVDTTGAIPGSRWGAAGWIDAAGNLWLFGGWGLDSKATNGNGALNDLWVYTPNSTAGQAGSWAWIKGSNTGSQNGIYGDEVIPYKTYENWILGGRSNGTTWIDNRGQLWLFGGEGYDSTSTTGNGYLNDLWRYVPYPD
ncbi:MAG TPA: kelch repeat-containing protein [Candidatus Acidoferrum sp.]|nr:kelch repeat-containing protein [Candidatus Acidoferrum sp.]